jgi:hypothetical protein
MQVINGLDAYNKKNQPKRDLLAMTKADREALIEQIKEYLEQRVREVKLNRAASALESRWRTRCLSHSQILGSLSRKKRLKSKDFLELYDDIWESNSTAPAKYKNPDHALCECLEMIKKQYGGPPF